LLHIVLECRAHHSPLFLAVDISALTAHRRAHYLPRLLDRQDIHHRLIFGTDYPVPAVYVVVWTRRLVKYGVIACLLLCYAAGGNNRCPSICLDS
jgi:hypothetical protein